MTEPLQARVFTGDARDLSLLQNGAVDLVVTSPPYWQIKDYGSANQIGYGQSLHEYLFDLAQVWCECFRVLKAGRRLCINIGDQFARTEVYGRYKVIPLHCEVISMCQSLGFDYLGSIIWQKKTTMNPSGGAVIMGSFPHPPNGIVELDYEHILLFKKPGESVKVEASIKADSALTKEQWKTYFAGHWHFGGARQLGHQATFPDELPRRLIRMFSFVGETVLDPFLGSGTTVKVALELSRNAVGWELNADYLPLIREKICSAQMGLNVPEVEFAQAEARILAGEVEAYQPHVEDARPLRDDKERAAKREAEPLQKVVEIVNARTLKLETGQQVALLGLTILDEKAEAARNYLEKSVRGKQVYLRFDSGFEDEAYVLLKNKIFINRKMIEAGLATVAPGNYKWRAKFEQLMQVSRSF